MRYGIGPFAQPARPAAHMTPHREHRRFTAAESIGRRNFLQRNGHDTTQHKRSAPDDKRAVYSRPPEFRLGEFGLGSENRRCGWDGKARRKGRRWPPGRIAGRWHVPSLDGSRGIANRVRQCLGGGIPSTDVPANGAPEAGCVPGQQAIEVSCPVCEDVFAKRFTHVPI